MMVITMAALLSWVARGQLLLHWWPIGIRLRQDAVAIGGVRWAERHPGKRHRKADVTWIWGETDPERLKVLRRHATYGRKPTPWATCPSRS